MSITDIFIVIFLIYLGVRLSKSNFDRGVERLSHFRMRYTLITLLILGFTAYVEQLPPAEKKVEIEKIRTYVEALQTDVQVIVIDNFNAAISAAKNFNK